MVALDKDVCAWEKSCVGEGRVCVRIGCGCVGEGRVCVG